MTMIDDEALMKYWILGRLEMLHAAYKFFIILSLISAILAFIGRSMAGVLVGGIFALLFNIFSHKVEAKIAGLRREIVELGLNLPETMIRKRMEKV